MRLDASGNPLGLLPFAICAAAATQNNPKAAWSGSNWLVVFESTDLNGTGYCLPGWRGSVEAQMGDSI